jgi:hypothetical protein
MLDGGTLEPARACSLISDASRAIAGAHAVGQAHLRLTPDAIRWTRGSGVKITGLGIDAALAGDGLTGPAAHDPSVADTTALAALLYAALTGYWPGEEPTRLPAAPVSDGVVCTPRQVSADVSSPLDSVITRALLQRPTRQGPPIQSPGDFADALAMVAPPPPLPEPAQAAPPGYQDRRGYEGYGYADPNNPDTWQTDRGHGGTAPYPPPSGAFPMAAYGGGAQYTGAQRPAADFQGRERGGPSRVMLTVVIVLVLAVIGATVWAIGFRKPGTPSAGGGSHPSTSAPTAAGSTVLTPANVSTFNIYGKPPGNTENEGTAQGATDNSLSTAWSTSYYFNDPKFGGLKSGTGLLIDMGKQVRLSQVEVLFSSDGALTQGATTAEIYLGNSAAMSKDALSNFTRVSPSATATGKHDYPVTSKVTGRYVLIWLTSLPQLQKPPQGLPAHNKYYEGFIYNVVVRGSAASGSS